MEQHNQPLLALSVRSGRHTGAQQAISMPAFSIGSSLDADLVLTDPSVSPHHARLSIRDGVMKVEAIASPLFLNGTELTANAAGETRLPSRLRVGNVEIDITEAGPTSKGTGMQKVLLALAALLILGGSAFLALPGGSSLFRSNSENQTSGQSLSKSQGVALGELRKAADSLKERLLAANIRTIEIATDGGVVSAKGTVISAAKRDWDALQVWFDGAHGRNVFLHSEVIVANPEAPEPPITVQSVWTGREPYLIDGQGNKHSEGVVLKDGWIIEKIEPGKVTLVKNRQRLLLTF